MSTQGAIYALIEAIKATDFNTEINFTAAEILTLLKTVDGAGSGLDADKLDGTQGSQYARMDFKNLSSGYSGLRVARNVSGSVALSAESTDGTIVRLATRPGATEGTGFVRIEAVGKSGRDVDLDIENGYMFLGTEEVIHTGNLERIKLAPGIFRIMWGGIVEGSTIDLMTTTASTGGSWVLRATCVGPSTYEHTYRENNWGNVGSPVGQIFHSGGDTVAFEYQDREVLRVRPSSGTGPVSCAIDVLLVQQYDA